MCTEGIVVKCQLMPLIVPQSICPSTSNQHPNQPSVNTQLTLFFILTTFAVRAKRAHLESLCCLQCTSHVTIKQNIHKGKEIK